MTKFCKAISLILYSIFYSCIKTNIVMFQVSYLIVDEAMHKLEMLDDPFLDQATELPTDLPFANDDEDSGCSGMYSF